MSRLAAPEIESDRPTMRADAAENRRRLLEAARLVFAERGVDAPLDEIARRAGVGNATLYRRFPTREALVVAVFEERLGEYARAAEEALSAPDPWVGFCQCVERVCAMQVGDQGLRDMLATFPLSGALAAQRERAGRAFAELVRRAQAAGELRPDFEPSDIGLLMMANAGIVRATGATAPAAWKRFMGFVLDGCRAAGARRSLSRASPPP